jgi:hypothetical protein
LVIALYDPMVSFVAREVNLAGLRAYKFGYRRSKTLLISS